MRKTLAIAALTASALTAALSACGSGKGGDGADTVVTHPLPDTLRVATLYSPASYFHYRDENMGFDYSLVSALAREKGMELDLTVAPSLAQYICTPPNTDLLTSVSSALSHRMALAALEQV